MNEAENSTRFFDPVLRVNGEMTLNAELNSIAGFQKNIIYDRV